GLAFHSDPKEHRVRASRLAEQGLSYAVEEQFDLLATKDANFQPAQTAVGPDGALYILDRGNGGRLLRLSWAGTKDEVAIKLRPFDTWAKTAKLADAELIKALLDDELTVREVAPRELGRRGDKNRAEVLKLFLNDRTPTASQIAAMGVLQAMPDGAVLKALRDTAENGDADLRLMGASLLALCAKEGDKEASNALLAALGEESPL